MRLNINDANSSLLLESCTADASISCFMSIWSSFGISMYSICFSKAWLCNHTGYCDLYIDTGCPTITKQTLLGISEGKYRELKNDTWHLARAAWSIPSIQIKTLSLLFDAIIPSNLHTCARISSTVSILLFTGTLYAANLPCNLSLSCINKVPHKLSALHIPSSTL